MEAEKYRNASEKEVKSLAKYILQNFIQVKTFSVDFQVKHYDFVTDRNMNQSMDQAMARSLWVRHLI